MSIDTSGKWWVGSEPDDIGEYLEAYSADGGYKTEEFRLSRCACGSVQFRLEADDNEGTARRTCAKCQTEHFICDSGEYWEDSEPEEWRCLECKSQHTNVGVGFALYPEDKEVKWLYVGCRCAKCGILGCFAGWKVAYAPSRHLFEQA
jgi:hypothetical protein